MGLDINVHDQWAVESMGRIQDRTKEHLGKTDVGIIRYRRLLRDAIRKLSEGDESALPMQDNAIVEGIQGPISIDAIASVNQAWEDVWRDGDEARRNASEWQAGLK